MRAITLQGIIILILAPPLVTVLWWLLSRGWATTVQGGNISERTRKRQSFEFWIVLGAGYFIEIVALFARRSH